MTKCHAVPAKTIKLSYGSGPLCPPGGSSHYYRKIVRRTRKNVRIRLILLMQLNSVGPGGVEPRPYDKNEHLSLFLRRFRYFATRPYLVSSEN